jgi:hypothetical protein
MVETHWRLMGPSGKVVTCVTVRDPFGLEVRAGFDDLDLLRSERVLSPKMAAMLASEWKATALAKGGFSDLDSARRRCLPFPHVRDQLVLEFQ